MSKRGGRRKRQKKEMELRHEREKGEKRGKEILTLRVEKKRGEKEEKRREHIKETCDS